MPDIQFSSKQSEQVDAFIDALLRDPKAVAPAALSPDLADFIRTLVDAEHVNVAHDVQARVWRKAYLAAQVQRLQQPTVTPTRGTVMTTTPITLTPRRVSLNNNLTLLAAAAAVIVLVAGMVAYSTIKLPPPSTAFGSNGQAGTATPILSATPSAASAITQPIDLTATAIIVAATATSAAQQTANAIVDPDAMLVPSATHTATPFVPTVVPANETPFPTFTLIPASGEILPPTVPPYDGLATPIPVTQPNIPPEAYANALRVPPNNMLVGGITAEVPYAIYDFEAPDDGMMDIYGVTADFPIGLSYNYADPASGGGGGGGGGGGEPPPRSAELAIFVKKGSHVQVTVTSANGTQFGQFNLGFYFDKGTILNDLSQPIKGSFEADGTHFRYYLFTGKAGTRLDLTASEVRGTATEPTLDMTMMIMEVQTTMGGNLFSGGFTAGPCLTFNGPLLCADDNSGKGSDPELNNVVIRADTLYAILVRPVPMGSTGLFDLSIREHAPVSIDEGPQEIKLDSQHRQNAVVFTGEAGKSYSLKAELTVTQATGQLATPIMVFQGGYLLTTLTGTTTQQIMPIMNGPVVVVASYPWDTVGDVIPATITFSVTPQ